MPSPQTALLNLTLLWPDPRQEQQWTTPTSDDLLSSAVAAAAAAGDYDHQHHHHHHHHHHEHDNGHEDDPSLDMLPLKRQRQEVEFLTDLPAALDSALDGLNATLAHLGPAPDPTHQHRLMSIESDGFVDTDETDAAAAAFIADIGGDIPLDPTTPAPKRRRGGSNRLASRARVNAAKTPADLLTAVLELYDEFANADKKSLEEADRQFYLRTREAFLERVGKMTVNSFGKRCRGKKNMPCGLLAEIAAVVTEGGVYAQDGTVVTAAVAAAAAAAAAANPITGTPGRKTTATAAAAQQDPLTVTLLPTKFSLCQIPPSALTDPATATEATNFLTAQLAGLATAADGSEYPHELVSFTRTPKELSLVLPSSLVKSGATDFTSLEAAQHSIDGSSSNHGDGGGGGHPSWLSVEAGWRFFRVEGPLPAYQTGVMGKLTGTLADAKVSVFVVSSFDTDYVGVKHVDVAVAKQALEKKAKCRVVVG
ncbi:hypothetical protein DFJ73DRAFT_804567 [Zopfochytrium polystomum]|nr:hypothetical protein DFJ73DRAFT_804567 [Zopfochytrium polystomum]